MVITDIIMPEQEGFETILKIRSEYPEIKIIAISGGLGEGSSDVLYYSRPLPSGRMRQSPSIPNTCWAGSTSSHTDKTFQLRNHGASSGLLNLVPTPKACEEPSKGGGRPAGSGSTRRRWWPIGVARSTLPNCCSACDRCRRRCRHE
jgi:hypothetical protein